MTASSALTDEMLRETIEQMPTAIFDSHDLIRQLMRRYPREYATALHMTAGQDPIQTLHAAIGTRLTTIETVEKTGTVRSLNVRGEETDNQGWRRR